MRPHRDEKLASVIEHELSKIILRELDIIGAVVTITDVKVGEDLLRAIVKLGIIPYERGPEVFKALSVKRGRLQHQLLKKMNVRPMPQIQFEIEEPKRESEEV